MAVNPHDAAPNGGGDDPNDDARSDVSSVLEEVDGDDFPQYFQEIRGRLFHSHGSSLYPLPVDANEQHRQNALHNLTRTIFPEGNIYVGPVREVLAPLGGTRQRKVVDLGTGTGRWVTDMAREFPHAKIYGLDIVPIATRRPPSNVQFEMHDLCEPTRFDSGSVDLVHARSLELATRDYRSLVTEAARILRGNGLFIACEWVFHPTRQDGGALGPSASNNFFQKVRQVVYERHGFRPIVPEIQRYIEQSRSFRSVQSETYPIRVSAVPPEVWRWYAETMNVLFLEGNVSPEEASHLVRGYVEELRSVANLWVKLYVVYAIKVQV